MSYIDTPIANALEAYGVDLMNTPEDAMVIVWRGGIVVEQFARDDAGELVLTNDGSDLERTHVDYPHPAPDEIR